MCTFEYVYLNVCVCVCEVLHSVKAFPGTYRLSTCAFYHGQRCLKGVSICVCVCVCANKQCAFLKNSGFDLSKRVATEKDGPPRREIVCERA